jgi:RNA polymerase sigma-70 factor, ECF subfamily
MQTTMPSLLMRLRQPNADEAWRRFVDLYSPFLMHVLVNRMKVRAQDAADLVQDVFATLLRTLPSFEYDPNRGKFRGYLRQVCASRLNDWRRKRKAVPANDAELNGLMDARAEAEIEQVWQDDHNRFLVRRVLQMMQAEFETATWKSCWECVVNDRPAAEVAKELGLTENAVLIRKCRVIQRLRQETTGLLDD